MAELSYEVGDCPYATMAAINEIGFANSIVVEAEGLSVAAEAFGLGSDEKPEDLLT